MSILIYLIKVNLALMLCWALYWVAFKKLTFFQWNRFYLLGSVVLSLILPLLRLQWKKHILTSLSGLGCLYLMWRAAVNSQATERLLNMQKTSGG